jgi:uncharacterized protein YbbK (DUF523 family)
MNDLVAVSACLLGIRCRYDGGSCYDRRVVDFVRDKIIVPVCPEIFGGLPTPREACEPVQGCGGIVLVRSASGGDYTLEYEKGAEYALQKIRESGAGSVVLKSKSPSCGCGQVYDGTFTHKAVSGYGLLAEKLLQEDVILYTENSLGSFEGGA